MAALAVNPLANEIASHFVLGLCDLGSAVMSAPRQIIFAMVG
jgi:hypothetical protein